MQYHCVIFHQFLFSTKKKTKINHFTEQLFYEEKSSNVGALPFSHGKEELDSKWDFKEENPENMTSFFIGGGVGGVEDFQRGCDAFL